MGKNLKRLVQPKVVGAKWLPPVETWYKYQACAEPRTSGGGLETQPIRDHKNALSVISASWRSGIMRYEQAQSRSNGWKGAVYHRDSPLSPQAIGCTSTTTACPLLPFYAQTIAPTTSFVALMLLEGCSTIVFSRLLCDIAAFERDAAVFTVVTDHPCGEVVGLEVCCIVLQSYSSHERTRLVQYTLYVHDFVTDRAEPAYSWATC
jgi:hypothetical protein